jgi:membrane protein DedA with SNARE-associated domain/rhodanese-related sulfurtransferase
LDAVVHLLSNYGLWVVLVAVFLDQGGVPVPAWPVLVLATAQAVGQQQSLWPILLVATLAALLADTLWYLGGRRYGARMMRTICRVSLSPDSCVASTRELYSRWGTPSLVFAKFIPGFAAIGTTLAGHERTALGRFAFFDGLGAALWAGTAVLLGVVFHDAVNEALATLESLGHWGLVLVVAGIAAFAGRKAWKRHQFLRELRMERISVDELQQLLAQESRPLLVDVRVDRQRQETGWIPGAVRVGQVAELSEAVEREVIVYCDCPNEASAARVAQQLKTLGFQRVRPLAGGLEAWNARGFPLERGAVS